MASVTGMTAEAIDALFDAMVTSVIVDDNGQLIYRTKDGTETNAGPIVAPKIAVDKAWPVGSIFISVVPTNPFTLIGAGGSASSWIRFGQGRVLVSQIDGNTRFDAAEETGGLEKVQLTYNESGMPYHSHTYSFSGNTGPFSNYPNTNSTPDNSTSGPRPLVRGGGGGSGAYEISGLNHVHSFAGGGTTSQAASDAAAAHENMPPFIVVYMWKRVS